MCSSLVEKKNWDGSPERATVPPILKVYINCVQKIAFGSGIISQNSYLNCTKDGFQNVPDISIKNQVLDICKKLVGPNYFSTQNGRIIS